mmetsp:Transcript_22024/g.50263  ORF Transcript_22024/g.50263 Transcript_22024/m.50263 type:complete len:210 (+) Transcript_22024:1731-2360(+)
MKMTTAMMFPKMKLATKLAMRIMIEMIVMMKNMSRMTTAVLRMPMMQARMMIQTAMMMKSLNPFYIIMYTDLPLIPLLYVMDHIIYLPMWKVMIERKDLMATVPKQPLEYKMCASLNFFQYRCHHHQLLRMTKVKIAKIPPGPMPSPSVSPLSLNPPRYNLTIRNLFPPLILLILTALKSLPFLSTIPVPPFFQPVPQMEGGVSIVFLF